MAEPLSYKPTAPPATAIDTNVVTSQPVASDVTLQQMEELKREVEESKEETRQLREEIFWYSCCVGYNSNDCFCVFCVCEHLCRPIAMCIDSVVRGCCGFLTCQDCGSGGGEAAGDSGDCCGDCDCDCGDCDCDCGDCDCGDCDCGGGDADCDCGSCDCL